MHPKELLQTLYIGDRGCKSIVLDGWNKRVLVQVTVISRIRSTSGDWEFYTDEDIEDGYIVFTGVESVAFTPPGPVPNDFINSIELIQSAASCEEESGEGKLFLFELSIDSVNDAGDSHEVILRVRSAGIHLEDPARPGVQIT